MFFVLTTTKNEKVLLNLAHIISISESKKGLFILCDDGNFFYCKESIEDIESLDYCLDLSY